MQTRKLLLKAADIEKMAEDRKVHFLNPNAVRINKSLNDAIGLNHIGVHIIYVEPGKNTTEYHKHHYEEVLRAIPINSKKAISLVFREIRRHTLSSMMVTKR